MMKGICSHCQTEVDVRHDGQYCLLHTVANKDGMPTCEGSFFDAPETITTKCLCGKPATRHLVNVPVCGECLSAR